MTPQQLAVLKANLIAAGLISPDASDDAAVKAANSLQASNPDALAQMMNTGPSWLTVIGLGAGAVAVYLIWRQYSKTKKLGEIERPEPIDTRHQLRGFGKSLGKFAGRSGGCRMGRRGLGDAEKYEFEPEIRLEGMRSKRRFKRSTR